MSPGHPGVPDASGPDRSVPKGWIRRRGWKRRIGWAALGLVGLFALIQAVPYGRAHRNPPVLAAPTWDSAQTEQLFMTACGDCHSNLTRWPWYTNIAPVSWLVQRDVDEGRRKLNLSELGRTTVEIGEITDVIRGGDMPPLQYRLIHRDASLSRQEKEALIQGLTATLGTRPTR